MKSFPIFDIFQINEACPFTAQERIHVSLRKLPQKDKHLVITGTIELLK